MPLTNEYFSYFPYAIKCSGGDYESVLVVANSKAYNGDGGYCEQALSKNIMTTMLFVVLPRALAIVLPCGLLLLQLLLSHLYFFTSTEDSY